MQRALFLSLFAALEALMLAHGQAARAGDFDKFDFSLRFPAAISRFATYADVAGVGGASAASKFQSSVNPASVALEPMPKGTSVSASPQFSTVHFDQGTRLDVFVESLVIDAGSAGRFMPTLAQVRSNKAADKSGLDYDFDMDQAQLGWGRRFGETWAGGVNLIAARSNTDFSTGGVNDSHTNDHTYGARVGVLNRVTERLNLGFVADYAIVPSETDAGAITHDTTHQVLLRPGVAFEYAKGSTLYVDYQFGRFANDTGSLVVNRFYAGAEQRIFEWLFLRGGVAADTRANTTYTAGLGLYPTDWISVDFGFQQNSLPELDPNFGRARTYGVSGSVSF